MKKLGRFLGILVLTTPLLVSVAHAAKPRPIVLPLPPSTAPSATGGECVLGHAGPQAWTVNYVDPPDDVYYTHLDADACGGGDAFAPRTAVVRLEFPVACPQTLAVAIVGAVGDSCPAPDDATVLCAPTQIEYTPPSAGVHDVEIELTGGCVISADAFLAITFVAESEACSTLATRPRLVTGDQCERCRSYNRHPGGEDDLCALLLPGRPIMNVLGDEVVPVSRSTWGTLRIRYR